jgi:hypothetical protein
MITARQHNAQFTGETVAFNSSQTINSGAAHQAAWERQRKAKEKIGAVLRKSIQDPLQIQLLTCELLKVFEEL